MALSIGRCACTNLSFHCVLVHTLRVFLIFIQPHLLSRAMLYVQFPKYGMNGTSWHFLLVNNIHVKAQSLKF